MKNNLYILIFAILIVLICIIIGTFQLTTALENINSSNHIIYSLIS